MFYDNATIEDFNKHCKDALQTYIKLQNAVELEVADSTEEITPSNIRYVVGNKLSCTVVTFLVNYVIINHIIYGDAKAAMALMDNLQDVEEPLPF